MASIEKSIEVDAPIREVYNQWTQFESFPEFMDAVQEVHQLDDRRLHWRAQIAGKEEEWDAEITEQVPDTRIAWRSTSGVPQGGAVDFHRISDETTKVTLLMDYEPQGITEKVGSTLGFDDRRVESDLEKFKTMMSERKTASGGWRGEVRRPEQG